MKRYRLATTAALVSASLLFLSQPAAVAQSAGDRTDYSVSLLGIPIASLSFRTKLDGRDYTISGSLKTSFIAEVIEPTRGTITSKGRIAGDRFQANSFEVKYTSGSKANRAAFTARDGTVRSATIEPKKKLPKSWIPVPASHKRSVVDPLASLVFPKGEKPCPQTVAVFDGESRFDLKLSPAGKRPFSTNGFSGEATVCSVRFVPKSGYRKDNSSIDYVRNLTGIEVWFARHPEGGYMAPVYAKIPTKVGRVVVSASRFGS
mgnify:FL=1